MLSPEYLWSISDSVVNIYDEMNNWAIQDMIERIMRAELYEYDKLPGTARYRAWMLNQAGMHYDELAKKTAGVTKKAEKDIMQLFIDAGLTAIANDFEPFEMKPYDIRQDRRATQILQAAYNQTNGELRNYTRTTLDRSNKLMIDTLDKAYFEVSTGTKTYTEVIREAIDTVSSTGCEVEYPKTGHVDSIETAVRRAVMTGVNQGTAKISLLNCEKLGTDYVIISAHMGARYSEKNKVANHLGWQGKVYKIHGTDTYENEKGEMITILNLEEETGFPSNPLGLCGYNCRHSFYPFLLGIDDLKKYKYIVTDEEKSKKQYDLSQKQRAKERAIRKSKAALLAYSTAIENCKDEKSKFELQLEYDKRAAKLQDQNKAYRAFCEDNNLQMEHERVKVAKWQREQAYQATRGANRYNAAKKSVVNKNENDIMERKKKDSSYIEPMPKRQLQKIMRGFKQQGGKIQMNEYTNQYLDKKKAEAITYDSQTILLHTNPGRAAVFEELIHATQYRLGKNDGTYVSRLMCEIEAQERMLKYSKEYKLTENEIKQTEKALVSYKKELADYKNGGD